MPASWKRPAALVFWGSVAWGALWLVVGAPEGGIKYLEFQVPALWSDELLQAAPAGPGWITNNLTDELLLLLITVSGLILGFARERVEDELIQKRRWQALARATWIQSILFLVATWTVYGVSYFYVLYAQLVSFLVVFNVLWAVSLRQHYTSGREE